jgi:hypothetical protein
MTGEPTLRVSLCRGRPEAEIMLRYLAGYVNAVSESDVSSLIESALRDSFLPWKVIENLLIEVINIIIAC